MADVSSRRGFPILAHAHALPFSCFGRLGAPRPHAATRFRRGFEAPHPRSIDERRGHVRLTASGTSFRNALGDPGHHTGRDPPVRRNEPPRSPAPRLESAGCASQCAISARGLNSTTANKLLVLIDGRTVYTPLFSGVFWDVQDVLLSDVERIEVISGPGATLWGANAVNGVINVITKGAKDTKGLLVTGGGGTQLSGLGSARYGGRVGTHADYRIYGKAFSRDPTLLPNGLDAPDGWHMGQGGFRLDWDDSASNRLSLQGDWYDGRIAQALPGHIAVSGGNVTAKWAHPFSAKSEVTAQAYYDHTHRNIPGTFGEDLDIYDIDVQHRAAVGARHEVVWGGGYRLINDRVGNTAGLAFLPAHVARQWFTAFAQDEIALAPERLHVTLGAKVEHNDYTGFEVQPSGRLNWTIRPSRTLWAAISRAVRTPSRIDRELFAPAQPPFFLAGGPNFHSEKLLAY